MAYRYRLLYSHGRAGYGSTDIGTAETLREAARMARRYLARYGTVRVVPSPPWGTVRLWAAPGDHAVHAELIESD